MKLPNRFLADLPPEATLSGTMVREACLALKRNREQHLATRSTAHLVHVIAETAQQWLQPESPFRRMALDGGPELCRFSQATIERGLDAFFSQLTEDNLQSLLEQDLGHVDRLDTFCATRAEGRVRSIASGPELLVHIASGNIPNPTLLGIALGLLVRSAQFVKCGRDASFLPRLFAHSLHEVDPQLAACIEIASWRGGDSALEEPLFAEADCVTITGSDEAIAAVRPRVPERVRLVTYGHRVSFAAIAQGCLSSFNATKLAASAVDDIVAWNQLGCLSPHVIYVQAGGIVSPDGFAEMLARELETRERTEPRGQLQVEESAAIASRRDVYRVRAAAVAGTRLWCSEGSTAWTVVHEADPRFQLSCLNRFIYVKPVRDLTEILQAADSVRGQVSTVGLAAPGGVAEQWAREFARWGVTRICPLGQMQNPPLTWRHDGHPALGDLITWTGWEM
jgi:hypothetical protein